MEREEETKARAEALALKTAQQELKRAERQRLIEERKR
jgi:hypothetical protein